MRFVLLASSSIDHFIVSGLQLNFSESIKRAFRSSNPLSGCVRMCDFDSFWKRPADMNRNRRESRIIPFRTRPLRIIAENAERRNKSVSGQLKKRITVHGQGCESHVGGIVTRKANCKFFFFDGLTRYYRSGFLVRKFDLAEDVLILSDVPLRTYFPASRLRPDQHRVAAGHKPAATRCRPSLIAPERAGSVARFALNDAAPQDARPDLLRRSFASAQLSEPDSHSASHRSGLRR